MSDEFDISSVSPAHSKGFETQRTEHNKNALFNAVKANAKEAYRLSGGSRFNPRSIQSKFKTLNERLSRPAQDEAGESKEAKKTKETQKSLETADRYAKQNVELSTRGLLNLYAQLHSGMSEDEILDLTTKSYLDPSNADDALDFLLKASEDQKEIQEKLIVAKEKFNETYGREIKAGKNIAEQAREFSKKGLGSTTGLRDLYRDITGNPREPIPLFEELSNDFEYTQMKDLIEFLLHSLGSDLKSKGPSINLDELKRLLIETRKLQAILGIYSFFEARMPIIQKRFLAAKLPVPRRLTFVLLAKQLVRYFKERFPSSDKVIQLALLLGIQESIQAQLIVFTQYRDAMRHVAPRLFKSERHRTDLYETILEALENLDEIKEEEEQ
ncbi:MAG: type III secretion system gatekeeper subunit SctW [Simkaniaceae bacterium]